jgi:hypothetical protein
MVECFPWDLNHKFVTTLELYGAKICYYRALWWKALLVSMAGILGVTCATKNVRSTFPSR